MRIGNIETNVPPEVWDRIFKHCEPVSEWDSCMFYPKLLPKSCLHPLLLVCRAWHDIAERRLYVSVSLGTNRDANGNRRKVIGKDVCERFCNTLQSNPRLALLVRELHLGTQRKDFEETSMHIRLVGICKNVERFSIHGYNGLLMDELKAAIAGADLVSLNLSCRCLGSFHLDGKDLFLLSELISPEENWWPRLEAIQVYLNMDSAMDKRITKLASAVALGRRPSLRHFCVVNRIITPTYLNLISEAAPMLERLKILINGECVASMQHCLQVWSTTLKSLDVQVWSASLKSPDIQVTSPSRALEHWPSRGCTIINSLLCELRELRISLPRQPVRMLLLLPRLEKLNYRGNFEDGVELARLLREGELPHLRDIEFKFDEAQLRPEDESISTYSREMNRFRMVMDLREVWTKRNITFKDPFTVDSEDWDSDDDSSFNSDDDYGLLSDEDLEDDYDAPL